MVSQNKRNHAKEHLQTSKVLIIVKVQAVSGKKSLKHNITLTYSDSNTCPYYKQRRNLIQPLLVLDTMHMHKVVEHRLKDLFLFRREVGRPGSMTVHRDYFMQGV